MTRYAMVINLHDCIGCGACDIACKVENELPLGVFFSKHSAETTGTFPKVKWSYRPMLCNQCSNPACAAACPTGAISKDEFGITVIDYDKCTRCGLCANACPYEAITPAPADSAGDELAAAKAIIKDGTATGADVQKATKADYPMHDPALDEFNLPATGAGAPLKCQMCKHLVYHGSAPRCVEACPAGARIFGDIEDIYGEVYQLTQDYEASVLQPGAGTEPSVYYIREFHKTW